MKAFRPLLFLITFLAVLIGANYYLGTRFHDYFDQVSRSVFFWSFLISFLLISIGMMRTTNSTTELGHHVNRIAGFSVGLYVYLLVSALVVHLISYGLVLSPTLYGIMNISLALLLAIYAVWHSTRTYIYRQDITIPNLKKSIKAAHITDTHIGHMRSPAYLRKIVSKINDEKVDIVFFTGDFLDSKYRLRPDSFTPLKDIIAPVFFVEGNHDVYTGSREIKNGLKAMGVQVLENQMVHWNEWQIIGLDHMRADNMMYSPHVGAHGPTIQSVLESLPIDADKPTVLLHHSPDGVRYADKHGVNLYLAGHTHAGQMWPITYVAKLIFEFNKGLHKFGNTMIYVSQGTGTFGPPMRLGTDSELTIFNFS